ncbi:MAG: hypothetical protein IJH80_07305 [Ruminococcus sp.]|nr:hypothetical protein [Ruminococcus sp.]
MKKRISKICFYIWGIGWFFKLIACFATGLLVFSEHYSAVLYLSGKNLFEVFGGLLLSLSTIAVNLAIVVAFDKMRQKDSIVLWTLCTAYSVMFIPYSIFVPEILSGSSLFLTPTLIPNIIVGLLMLYATAADVFGKNNDQEDNNGSSNE